MSAAKRWKMTVAFSTPSKTPHTRAVSNTKGDWVKWEDHQKALINNVHYIGQLGEQSAEIAHLRKEIQELKSQPDPLTVYLYAAELGKDAYKKLKAELAKTKADVERLECAILTGNAITPDAKPE
jgi:SMC interacting uncharacterized protein involved in chromosome segregation